MIRQWITTGATTKQTRRAKPNVQENPLYETSHLYRLAHRSHNMSMQIRLTNELASVPNL